MMADLSSVKAGDKLYVKRGHYDTGRIVTVDRLTPSGRVIAGTQTFEKDGRLRGGDGWNRTWAEVATQYHADKVEQAALANKMHRLCWETHSLATLRAVQALLAQGIEAREGRDPSSVLDAKRESPVPEGNAPR